MGFSGLILTKLGKMELEKAEMGEPFCLSDIVFGDGAYESEREDITELVSPVMSLPITKVWRGTAGVNVECDFNSADVPGVFSWREIGIIANGKLCYYDNAGDNPEYINPETEALVKQKRMRFVLLISSKINVNVTIGSSLYALDTDMQKVLYPQFEMPSGLCNLVSGESIFLMFGKIARAIAELNNVGEITAEDLALWYAQLEAENQDVGIPDEEIEMMYAETISYGADTGVSNEEIERMYQEDVAYESDTGIPNEEIEEIYG